MANPRSYKSTERLGVNAIERRFLKWNWIFREQPTSDFGVDAEVEVCAPSGKPTGKLVKLQIKAGRSWFRKENQNPIAYYAKEEHIDYWLRHTLPVVLVLWDPRSDIAYWVHVNSHSVRQTPKGYVIDVPRENNLDAMPTAELSKLAGPQKEPNLNALAQNASRKGGDSSGLKPLLDAVAAASTSIDMTSFTLDQELLWSLRMASRHATTRVLVNHCPETLLREYLVGVSESPNLQIRTRPLLHVKQTIIDSRLLIYCSANATASGWRASYEHIFGTTEKKLLESAANAFSVLWSQGKDLDESRHAT